MLRHSLSEALAQIETDRHYVEFAFSQQATDIANLKAAA